MPSTLHVSRKQVARVTIGLGILGLAALMPMPGQWSHGPESIKLGTLVSTAFVEATGHLDSLFPKKDQKSAADSRGPANALEAIGAFGAFGEALAGVFGHPDNDAVPEVTAFAPIDGDTPATNPLLTPPPAIRVDITGVREAIAAYRSGDLAAGDAAAATTTNPLARTTVEWVALHLLPRLTSFERISTFLNTHPTWPAVNSLRERAEAALYGDRRDASLIKTYFAERQPLTTAGRLALARVAVAEGHADIASSLVRSVWRNDDLGEPLQAAILSEFGSLLSRPDHMFRAERLLYKEKSTPAMQAAILAGPDMAVLARAFIAVSDGATSDKVLSLVPPNLRTDPAFLFARLKLLRHQAKFAEAAQAMLATPRDPALLVDPDAWWAERRMIARKVLDLGDAKTAYRLCSENSAASAEAKIDAEFHSGWIALRFLNNPLDASKHFAAAAAAAVTPQSVARAAYWQGRAAEASQKPKEAQQFYGVAADRTNTYYGQLAGAALGRTDVVVKEPRSVAEGDDRNIAVQSVELLEALDQKDLALSLALELSKSMNDESQLAALADVLVKASDARATLLVSKAAVERGFALDDTAFPTFGVPAFAPLGNSAGLAVVYAVARQESAFATTAQSGAGAKGLMQMITSTAQRTATREGVPFDETRLINDAAFNAQLGAAHLGELLAEQRGSLILTFAAYNAGGKRVKEWIAAYGDPRDPKVDPVDWVERIPIDETRNYVQRVFENLEMYRSRFGTKNPIEADKDLRVMQAQL